MTGLKRTMAEWTRLDEDALSRPWTWRGGKMEVPAPVELETLALPRDDRGGLDDDQAAGPVAPHPRDAHPERPIPSVQL